MKIQAKKSLGQHFLTCSWVVSTLVKAADLIKEDTVIEVGPGTGVLTCALAHAAKHVIAVEKDENLADDLGRKLLEEKINNVTIVTGDILKVLPEIVQSHKLSTVSYKLVSNIPYYLTSRLLKNIFELQHLPECILFTIQKEVAERIVAHPPHMNMLALSVQVFGTPKILKTVPRDCFSPRPKVDSAIIKIENISNNFFLKNALDKPSHHCMEHLVEKKQTRNDKNLLTQPHDTHRCGGKELFFHIARAGFSHKRKMLTNTLTKVFPKEKIKKALENSGLSEKTRPEELSAQQWTDILREIEVLQ